MTGFPLDDYQTAVRQWRAVPDDVRVAADEAFYWLQDNGGELPTTFVGRRLAFGRKFTRYFCAIYGIETYLAALDLRCKILHFERSSVNFCTMPETLVQQGGAADEEALPVNACAPTRKAFNNPSLFQIPGDEKKGPTTDPTSEPPSVWKRLETELQAIGYRLKWFRSPFAPKRGLDVATAFFGWFGALEGYGRALGIGIEEVVRRAAAVIRELRPGATTRELVGRRAELVRRIKAALRAIAPAGRRRISEIEQDARKRGETPVGGAVFRQAEAPREPERPANPETVRDALAALCRMTGARSRRPA